MPDIFISFAHVDDQPVSGEEKGWVTHFVDNLRKEVSRKMGRAEHCQLWIDYCLSCGDGITPEIERQLGETHVMLILLSPGWLASKWCQRELEIFSHRLTDAAGRIFVVELDPISTENKPAVLHDSFTCQFWKQADQNKTKQLGYPVPQSSDVEYYYPLVNLSRDLATALKNRYQASPVQAAKGTVYVAPVDYPLRDQRASLISELRQFGIDVLPRNNALDANMDAALAQCSHFVQLLDEHWTMGVPCNQHFTAEAAGKPILQWRDPKLDYTGAQVYEDQKKLLEGKTVIAAPLADFIRLVREAVLPRPKSQEDETLTSHNGEQMVFVHAAQEDFDHAHSVAQVLKTKGYGIALPRYQGDPALIRKSMERGYQSCDVMLLLQQKASTDVVEDFLSAAQRYTNLRKTKLHILVCRCKEKEEEELFFVPPGTLTLVCGNKFNENCLEQFLAEGAA